jgi:anionic cell wall polymer biosynthesis LytR-Cps2A-Psr (LCP) family protein
MLFQIKASTGIAVDSALLSVGGANDRANMITIPSTTIVDVATGGTLPFGEVARLPDPNGSANALSDAIGVDVDATFAMDTLAFSGLVDAVGGVTVDVDVNVVQKQADGSEVVLIPAGPDQLLQGPAAAAYATYLAPGEPEEARMARFSQVFRLTVQGLPYEVTKVEAIFSGLGASAKATVPTDQVAAFFVRLKADVLSDDVVYRILPVKPIDTGGPSAYRIDQEESAAMVAELFADAQRTPGPNSKVRVLVQNGVGSPGLNAAARQLLVDAGYTYVNGGNAETFGLATTAVVVPDSTPESLTWGADIATALGVPATAVQVASTGQSVADVIVVLGADFTPTSS